MVLEMQVGAKLKTTLNVLLGNQALFCTLVLGKLFHEVLVNMHP